VDVHTHPGAEKPGDPFEDTVLRRDLADQAAAGVLLIWAPGSAARIPAWAHDEDGLPRVRSAGPWLATPGRFFPDWGRRTTEAELAAAALDEATASAAIQQAASSPRSHPGGTGNGRLNGQPWLSWRRTTARGAGAIPAQWKFPPNFPQGAVQFAWPLPILLLGPEVPTELGRGGLPRHTSVRAGYTLDSTRLCVV
jgi:hypothetical protein